jgi:hypothetical protein
MKQQQLTEEQIKYIESLFDYCEIKDLKKLKTPEELHLFIYYHNRDGGEFAYRWVIENTKCDKGTALMVYWRAEPVYFYEKYAQEKEVPEHALDIYQTIKEIEKRIQAGFYKNHIFKYDAISEGYLSKGFDSSKLKQTIPKEMFEFDKGVVWENPLQVED